ncbi:MAG: protein kinase [Chitinivibrionales bacterium]|nr:protein kinase [Chitinivibrionales bacterium]MBD3394366.1 protein kinase [Chitinivibrionales bacterium]
MRTRARAATVRSREMSMTLFSRLKKGYDSVDGFVQKIGAGLPIRLAMEPVGRTVDEVKRQRTFERLRATFLRHKPAIVVGRHLGTGGFADVFEATSNYERVGDFAMKVLRSDLLQIRKAPGVSVDEEEMRVKEVKKRFRNESFVQWHLSQNLRVDVAESVVRVYDHGEFDSRSEFRFILMERMGSTLRDFINEKGSVMTNPAVNKYKARLMCRIAEIIGSVHGEGVFHRDIKPENILFPRNDSEPGQGAGSGYPLSPRVKLGDFGTVRWISTHGDRFDGIIIGSQFYLSPEQIFHPKTIDPRTDIYSFGVVCYELLYGVHPKSIHRKDDARSLLERLATEPPTPQSPPEGFGPLNDIILHCMKDLRSRYQTMDDVAGNLRTFCAGLT